MKPLKNINRVVQAVFMIALAVMALNHVYAIPMEVSAPVLVVAALVLPSPEGVLQAGIYREAWDKELITRFNTADENTWRQGIRDLSRYFSMLQDGESVVVNLTYFGVSPDVLINNTSYPIAVQQLDAENIVVTIHKFQTKATPITDDELYGLNLDKMRAVQESHVIKVEEEKNGMAIHSVAPNANTAATPVLLTTGDLVDGRRMLRREDIIKLRKEVRKLKHPVMGRRLVLCDDHVSDLLHLDQKFADQYYNYSTGKIANIAGFELYEAGDTPFFNATTKQKLAYGAAVTSAHTQSSVYFHLRRVVQGRGFTKNYLSPASQDPLNQRNLFNIRTYDIVTPYKQEGIAAIASATS